METVICESLAEEEKEVLISAEEKEETTPKLVVPKLILRVPKEFQIPVDAVITYSEDSESEEEEGKAPDVAINVDEAHAKWTPTPPAPPKSATRKTLQMRDRLPIQVKLDRDLSKYEDALEFIRYCLNYSAPKCQYCNHARNITVNAYGLVSHMLERHHYTPAVNGLSAKEAKKLNANCLMDKLEDILPTLQELYINGINFKSIYECFKCRVRTKTHKELVLHNSKMHSIVTVYCMMCRAQLTDFTELLCHICPGAPHKQQEIDIRYRCCLCNLSNIPSSFRLMVHLREKHNSCELCLENCLDQNRLSSHVMKHRFRHFCYRCNKSYRNKKDITNHLNRKHGTESTRCTLCRTDRWRHVYHFCKPKVTKKAEGRKLKNVIWGGNKKGTDKQNEAQKKQKKIFIFKNLNLSESSEDEEVAKTVVEKENKNLISTEKEQNSDKILDIRKNFLNAQAYIDDNLISKDEADEMRPLQLHVAYSNHDYCQLSNPNEHIMKERKSIKKSLENNASDNKAAAADSSSGSESSSSSASSSTNSNINSSNSTSSDSKSSDDSNKSHKKSSVNKSKVSNRSSHKKHNKHNSVRTKHNNKGNDNNNGKVPMDLEPPRGPQIAKSNSETSDKDSDDDFYAEHPLKEAQELMMKERDLSLAQTKTNAPPVNTHINAPRSNPAFLQNPDKAFGEFTQLINQDNRKRVFGIAAGGNVAADGVFYKRAAKKRKTKLSSFYIFSR